MSESSQITNNLEDDTKTSGGSILVESVVVVVLVAVILFALNYFSLIPFSKIFPWLSFLPTSTQKTLQKTAAVVPGGTTPAPHVTYVISPNSPQYYKNTSDTFLYQQIPGSVVQILGKIKIHTELQIIQPKAYQVATLSGALLFDNDLAKSPKDHRFLSLFYYFPDSNWGMAYHIGDKAQYSGPILPLNGSNIYGDFDITVSVDGKTVTVDPLSTGMQKVMKLSDSLYSATNTMSLVVQVPPHSEIDILSLSYQY